MLNYDMNQNFKPLSKCRWPCKTVL